MLPLRTLMKGSPVIASVALITLLLAGCSFGNPQPNPTESPSATSSSTPAPAEETQIECDSDKMEADLIDATDALLDAKADRKEAKNDGEKEELQTKVDEAQATVDTLEAAIELCQDTEWLDDIRDQMTFPGHFTYFCELNDLGLIDFTIYAGPEHGPNSDANPKRVNTLNLSVPLLGGTPEEMQDYFWQNLCSDPFLGLAWGYVVGNLEIDGVRVFDIEGNEKLDIENLADITLQKINNLAESFLLQEGATDKEVQTFADKNTEYKYYVQTLIAILQQFKLLGVQSLTSTQNWRLEGPSAGIANVVESPTPDSLPALLYGVTEKGQCEPELLIGVNLEDMRPEVFNPADLPFCQFNPPPPPPPPPSGGCVTDCGGTPPCVTNCNPPCPPGECKGPEVPTSGTDNTTDSGTGTEPPAPSPTEPPEAEPPVVIVVPTPDPTPPPANEGGEN